MPEIHFITKCVLKSQYSFNNPELERELAVIVSFVRGMDGCLSIDILEVPGQPQMFYFCSRWASQQQFDAHLSPDYVKVVAGIKDKYTTVVEPVVTQLVSI